MRHNDLRAVADHVWDAAEQLGKIKFKDPTNDQVRFLLHTRLSKDAAELERLIVAVEGDPPGTGPRP